MCAAKYANTFLKYSSVQESINVLLDFHLKHFLLEHFREQWETPPLTRACARTHTHTLVLFPDYVFLHSAQELGTCSPLVSHT